MMLSSQLTGLVLVAADVVGDLKNSAKNADGLRCDQLGNAGQFVDFVFQLVDEIVDFLTDILDDRFTHKFLHCNG